MRKSKDQPPIKGKKKRNVKYGTLKQALEPRMLFDASLVPAPTDASVTGTNDAPTTPDQTTPTPSHPVQPIEKTPILGEDHLVSAQIDAKSSTDITKNLNTDQLREFASFMPAAKELIFIDSRLQNTDTLIEGLSANAEVHFLDLEHDGIDQIDSIIKNSENPISAIHILSHGGSGGLDLGSTVLTSANLTNDYADTVSSWRTYLKEDANVLLYGCGVAEGYVGQKFVTDLSHLLDRSVAASIDATGSNLLGGNWDLEYQTGLIKYGPSEAFSQQALAGFYYVLAKPVLDLNGPTAFTATDSFSSGTYTGGTNWSTGWVEFDSSPNRAFSPGGATNSDNSPTGGNIVQASVASGGTVSGLGTAQEMAIIGHADQSGDYIGREVNLLSYTSANLSFSYRTAGLSSADAIQVNISTNAGGSFVTLGTLANVTSNTTASFDISAYISDHTVIQFQVARGFSTDSSQLFFFDNVNITANGNNFYSSFSEQTGVSVPIIGNNASLTDSDAGQLFKSASVLLNNRKAGDTFAVGALPTGITASIDNTSGVVTLTATSPLGTSAANILTALKAVTFGSSSGTLDTAMRNITITVTDTNNETSLPATAFVAMTAYDDPTVTVSHAYSDVSRLATLTGRLFDDTSLTTERTPGSTYDYDKDTAGLSSALLSQATQGTVVVNADGTFTYTPYANATGSTDSFTYSLTSLAQVIGVNYQIWNTGISSLKNNFPTGSPAYSGFLSSFDVDKAAIASGNASLDNFVVRFNNTLTITTAGSYTFYSGSDDGSVVYIDGQLVVDNDGAHSFLEKSGAVQLSAGTHTIQVDFFENSGQEDLIVSYLGPDTSGIKTNLSSVGTVLANNTVTGTVVISSFKDQTQAPRLALGGTTEALDNFSTNTYSGNAGSFQWDSAWVEVNETTSPTSGEIQIINVGGDFKLRIQDRAGTGTQYIGRSVDLLGTDTGLPTRVGTQLSFDYDVTAATSGSVQVQLSTNYGTSWTTLDTLSSSIGTTGTKTYDISNYATGDVILRFLPTSNNNTRPVYIDNVKVSAVAVNYTANTYLEGGAAVSIGSAQTRIVDLNGDNISSAIVTLKNAQTGDVLQYTGNNSNITSSFSNNVLTLTGVRSQAEYMAALQDVKFSNTTINPSNVNRTIEVVVKDSSNNSSNTAVVTIGVEKINHAPDGISKSISLSLNTSSYIFQTGDFAFTDIDNNALQAVKIPTISSSIGTLQYDSTGLNNWIAVTANQTISASDIAAGRLRFVPAVNTSGIAGFTFQVQDAGGTNNGGANLDSTPNTFTFNILTGPNSSPNLARDLILNSGIEDNFNPTSRTISQLMTDNGSNAFVDADINATLKGLAIVGNTANLTTEGTWQYSTDGSNWYSISVVGDNAATMALALSASTQIRFVPVENFNGTPPSLVVRALDDTFTGTFTNGSVRSLLNSGTNGGSSAISGVTRNIVTIVTPINDAPNIIINNPILNSISATQVNNAGQLISDFVKTISTQNASYVTDVDLDAQQGVAILSAAGTNGTWEYSTDGGTNWNAVGSVNVNSALLLRSTDKIRFNPDGVNAGSGALGYRAWDQTSGTAGAKVNTSSYGGTTAFSVLTDVATINSTAASGPTLTNISTPLTYIENAAAGIINSSLTLSGGSSTFSSAKISITNFVLGQDALSFTNTGAASMGNIVGSFNTSTGILTLTSSGSTATTAQWQAALRAVKYANTSDAPTVTPRSINTQINDNSGQPSNVLTTSIFITSVNDAPTSANQAYSLTQSSIYVFDVGNFTFSDAKDANADSLQAIQITGLPSSGTLRLNGTAVTVNTFITVADIAAGKLTFTSSASNSTPVISFKVRDTGGTANGGVDTSTTSNTVTFNVSGANAAPTLINATPVTLYPSSLYPSGFTEDDVSNSGQSILSFSQSIVTDSANSLKGIAITGISSAVNGTWEYSLDGTTWIAFPTVSNTSALLLGQSDYIRFVPDAKNAGSGSFTFRAWDQTSGVAGTSVSTSTNGGTTAFSTAVATAQVATLAVNDAPAIIMAQSYYSASEQISLVLSNTGISISDVDAANNPVVVTLTVGEGNLSIAGSSSLTIANSGTSNVTITGTITQINNLLNGTNGSLTYINNNNAPSAATTFNLTVNDQGNIGGTALTSSLSRTINITAINDAPILTGIISGTYEENKPAIFFVSGAINVSDPDKSTLSGETLTIALQNYTTGDLLQINNQGSAIGQIGVSGGSIYFSGNLIGTYTGGTAANLIVNLSANATPAAVQALISQLQYSNTSHDPTINSTSRNVSITLDDNGNQGTGGSLSTIMSGTINITAVNDAPTLAMTQVFYNATEQTNLTLSNTGISINDVDAGSNPVKATLSVGEGIITIVGTPAGVTVQNSGTGTVTLTGTVLAINNLLSSANGITYINNSDTPSASTTLNVKVNDQVAGSADVSLSRTINITAVNDAPTLAMTQASYNATEQTSLTLSNTGISINDVDAGSNPVVVTLSVGEGIINVTGSGVTIGNSGTGTVTLTGTVAAINTILSSTNGITYINNSDTPSASTTLNVKVNDQVAGSADVSLSRTINITAVNDAPTLAMTQASYNATEQTSLTLSNTGISINDVDAGSNPVVVTLSVGEGIINITGSGVTIGNSGTGTVTLTGTVAAINTILSSTNGITYINNSDTPSASTTLNVKVNDQVAGSADVSLSRTINIAAVNDAPTLAMTQASYNATEQTSLTLSNTGISINDVDAGSNPVVVTLSVGEGIINVTGSGVTIGNSGTGTVTLTGTVAAINTILSSANGITYINNSDTPSASTTLNVKVNDQVAGSADVSLSRTINIAAVNDAPTLAMTQASYNATEQTSLTLSNTGISINDVDAGSNPVKATLSVGEGIITIVGTPAGVTVQNSGTGTVTLTGTVLAINNLLSSANGITYINNSDTPSASTTLNVKVNDQVAGSADVSLSRTINITAVNDAPTLAMTQASYNATEQTSLTLSNTGISINDVDAGSDPVKATLSVGEGIITIVGTPAGVTVQNSGTGTVTLTGTVLAINNLLSSANGITYINNSDTPSASTTLNVKVNDQVAGSADVSLSRTINITAVNDAPTLAMTQASYNATEQTSLTLSNTGISINDVDAGSDPVKATLSVGEGIITIVGTPAGVTVQNSGTGTVTLTGTVLAINNLLSSANGITYINNSDTPSASTTLNVKVNDQVAGSADVSLSRTINITAVNDAPTLAMTQASYNATEQTSLTLSNTGISINDVDAGSDPVKATLSVGEGIITIVGTPAGVTVQNSGTGTVTLTGTVLAINNLLSSANGITYINNSDTPSASTTLNVKVNDQVAGSADVSLSRTINITAVNDAPTLAMTQASYNATEQTSLTLSNTGISINDVDAGSNPVVVTLSVGEGIINITGSGVTIGNSGTGTVTLTGTVAAINTILSSTNGITYINNSDTPSASTTLNVKVNDQVAGSADVSLSRTINIAAVNDAPTLAMTQASYNATEQTSLTLSNTGISINDVDAGSNPVVVTLSVGEGIINVTGSGVTIGNSGTGTVILTGTVAAINTILSSANGITYINNSDTPSASTTLNVKVNDQVAGSADVSLSRTINIAAVNDAPTLAMTQASYNATEQTSLTLSNTGISINDVDAGSNPVKATLSVGEGIITIVGTPAGVTVQNSGTGTVTLTGTVLAINNLLSSANGITYINNSDTPSASTTLNVKVNDQVAGSADVSLSRTINIAAVNDAPTLAMTQASYNATEQTSLTLSNTGISINDVDAGSDPVKATLSVGEGIITIVGTPAGVTVQNSGTGTVTLTGTVLAINNLLSSANGITYINNSDTPSASTTLNVKVNDQVAGSADVSLSRTINIAAVNDAPTLAMTQASYNATEQTSLTLSNTGISINDVDAGSDPVKATLSVGEGIITIVGTPAGVTVQNSGTGTVTLTGTVLAINNLLSSANGITYINNSDTPSASTTLNVKVNDQVAGSADVSLSRTINIAAVNDAPTLAMTQASYNATEQTSLTLSNTGISINDVDAGSNPVKATLSVGEGIITIVGTPAGVTVQNSGTGTVTLTGTVLAINNLLSSANGITYINNSDTPSASTTLNVKVNDQVAGSADVSLSRTINIAAVNDAPTLAMTQASYNATEQTSLTLSNTGISINDVDAGSNPVVVTLSVGEGIINVTGSGVTIGNSGTGTVTLTGTVAAINTILSSTNGITYINNSDTPSASTTLNVKVNDQVAGSADVSLSRTINIAAVNDAPTLAMTQASYNATEQTSLILSNTGISINDVDAGSNPVVVTLSVGEGIINITGSGVTIGNSGTGTVTLTGTVAAINTILSSTNGITYINNSDTPSASTTLNVKVNDQVAGSADVSLSRTINIAAVNDAPTLAMTQASYNATEQTSFTLSNTGISINDVDAGSNPVVVTLSVGEGIINVTGSGVTIGNSGTGTVTLTGTVAAINTILSSTNGITYINNSDTPSASTTLNVKVNDQVAGSADVSLSRTINIAAVNDAPTLAMTQASYNATEQTSLTLSNTGISINDVDAGSNPVVVTLSVGEGIINVTGSGVTIGNSGTGTVTLTGTVAAINTILSSTNGITYINNSDTPSASTTLNVKVNDQVAGSADVSLSRTINITAVNDAPTLAMTQASYNATEQTSLTLSNTGISINDVDAGSNPVVVTLSVGEGIINVTGSGVTIGNSGTGTVTLTGTVAAINTILSSTNGITYINNSDTPSASTTLNVKVNDQVAGSADVSLSRTINIAAVNDAPTLAMTQASYNATEQTSLTLSNTGISINDVDAGSNPVKATLSVGEGIITIVGTPAGVTVQNSGTGTVTLTGTVLAINNLLSSANGITYINNSDTPSASTTLNVKVNDQVAGSADVSLSRTINIAAVNDAPTLAMTQASYNATEQTSLTLSNTGISINDVDAGSNPVVVTLSVGEGIINITGSGVTIGNSGTGTVTLTGTVAAINTILSSTNGITYINNSDTPSASTTLNVKVNDQVAGSADVSLSRMINIAAVNDAPTLAMTQASYNAPNKLV